MAWRSVVMNHPFMRGILANFVENCVKFAGIVNGWSPTSLPELQTGNSQCGFGPPCFPVLSSHKSWITFVKVKWIIRAIFGKIIWTFLATFWTSSGATFGTIILTTLESFDTLDTFKSFLTWQAWITFDFFLLLFSDKVLLLLLKMISAPWDQNNTISWQIIKNDA